jgi:hypothetical protein
MFFNKTISNKKISQIYNHLICFICNKFVCYHSFLDNCLSCIPCHRVIYFKQCNQCNNTLEMHTHFKDLYNDKELFKDARLEIRDNKELMPLILKNPELLSYTGLNLMKEIIEYDARYIEYIDKKIINENYDFMLSLNITNEWKEKLKNYSETEYEII